MKLARLARLPCRVTSMAGCGREPTFGLLGRAGGHNPDLASVTLITISFPKGSLKVCGRLAEDGVQAPGPPFAELSSEADVPVTKIMPTPAISWKMAVDARSRLVLVSLRNVETRNADSKEPSPSRSHTSTGLIEGLSSARLMSFMVVGFITLTIGTRIHRRDRHPLTSITEAFRSRFGGPPMSSKVVLVVVGTLPAPKRLHVSVNDGKRTFVLSPRAG
jgi:hypothetical protein